MIEYTLRPSARARRVSITIRSDGTVVVTMPRRGNPAYAERFVRQKAAWIARARERVKKHVALPSGRSDYMTHKEAARRLVRARLAFWNARYGFRYSTVSIRDQKTRWGSCSKRGTLSFNYKIIHLPAHLADYVIVHELCHLKEFNHSVRFWALMAKTIPNPRGLRRELKKYRLS